ncbi:MAG: hypothetical protein ACREBS_11330 [Nitrososphaerales archaeon]
MANYLDLVTRIIELIFSVGLIASCVMLFRFFRGGIMAQSFFLFSVASTLFLVDRVIAALVSSDTLPDWPYNTVHLSMEIVFVALLLVGFIQLYRNWMRVQYPAKQKSAMRVLQ